MPFDCFINIIICLYLISISVFPQVRIFFELVLIFLLVLKPIKIKASMLYYIAWRFMLLVLFISSLLWSINLEVSLYGVRGGFEIFIIGVLLLNYIDSKEKLKIIIKMFFITSIVLSTTLIVNFESFSVRLGTEWINANEAGIQLSITCIFLFHSYYQTYLLKKKRRILTLIVFFAILIFLTGSKKALMFVCVGLWLVYTLNLERKNRMMIIVPVSALGLIGGYYLMLHNAFLYQIIGNRIESFFLLLSNQGMGDLSSRIRIEMITEGISAWVKKPLLGYGINTYESTMGFNEYSHNNFVELLYSVGILGTLLYYAIYIYMLYQMIVLIKAKIKSIYPLFICFIVLLISEMGAVTYGNELYQIIIVMGFSGIIIGKAEVVNNINYKMNYEEGNIEEL